MPRYSVRISFEDVAYVEVDADNEEQAEEKAYDLIDSGDVEIDNQYDDPIYTFEIEELDEED